MQDPSIGWPIYIRVVRIIIETGVVSGSACFIIAITSIAAIYVMINELRHEIVYSGFMSHWLLCIKFYPTQYIAQVVKRSFQV